jgi:hypothetical protein
MVRFDDDVLVIPRDVDDGEARYEKDAVCALDVFLSLHLDQILTNLWQMET